MSQENCRRRVVCRRENGEWVKRPVGGFGLSGQVWRVGQENCRRRVVCRVKYGEWVKGIGDGVWSVGSSMASGSRGLSACGLSGQVWQVGQRNCRRRVVCRRKFSEWVKGIGDGVWSGGAKTSSGSKELSADVVCRRKFSEWVKGIVGGCGLSARKGRVNQRNHTYRMPQTLQIATQIKIAKILKT